MGEPIQFLTSGITSVASAIAGIRNIDTRIINRNHSRKQLQNTTSQLTQLPQRTQDQIRPALEKLKYIQTATPTELAYGTPKSRLEYSVVRRSEDLKHRSSLTDSSLSLILGLVTSQCQDK
jgi:hypothetical protein